ncbi:MAG: hypothetical protein IJX33_01150 [Akkermansia sp.]|nr:hypothetical protein [Akkermansia sp.]
MRPQTQKEHRHRVLELPELLSGLLVLFVVLWEACFEGVANSPAYRDAFVDGSHLILCGLVWFNTLVVFLHLLSEWVRYGMPGRFLWVQLLVGIVASVIFYGGVWEIFGRWAFMASLVCSFLLGGFSIGTLGNVIRARRSNPAKQGSRWSPAVRFFTYMVVLVLLSTLLLLTPGATNAPLSPVDALFTCASATSITGLTTVDVATTFTPLGKLVLLLDIQIGAIGVMTFSYFVLMMVGKRLAVRDSMSVSGMLDQQGVNVVPALLRAVFFVTLMAEVVGAVCLYYLWKGMPGFPQEDLWGYAIFHSVSAFCNAGINIFPAGMEQVGVANCKTVQLVMILLVLAGTVGFGVYLEGLTRLKNKLAGKLSAKRWSTNSWLVLRVMLIVMLVGTVGLTLLAAFEPSAHQAHGTFNIWESLWNAVGRSAGFALSDIGEYGPVYQLFLAFLMFVGGNPAGTGGGVYAPVFALCLLEVYRVLQGKQDLELHNRRIARNTVERAMATVVLSIFWIVFTTLLLLLLEPAVAQQPQGVVKLLFMEVSAYTTTGFDLGALTQISDVSKFIVTLNMLFGRVGMFTFMLIFIRQQEPNPIRLPETRLPLN